MLIVKKGIKSKIRVKILKKLYTFTTVCDIIVFQLITRT